MHGKLLKVLFTAVVVLALAFPFLLALEKVSDSDTFWHLKTGEWILSHGSIPGTDPFSATAYGKPWLDWEWLFQAAIYGVYTWGGFNALVVVKAAIVFLTGLVLFLACRRNGAGSPLAALVVMATFVAARERLEVRPDVLVLLFAAITIGLLEAARRGKPLWLWGLPLVQVLWINTHTSFPLGIALAGIYGLVHGIEFSLRKDWRCVLLIAGTLLLTCTTCLMNPFGIELVRHAIEQMRTLRSTGTIGEWQPTRLLLLTEPNWALTVFWWLFWLNPVVLIVVLANQRGKFPWSHALVVGGMSVLAWRASQFMALYAIVTGPLLPDRLAGVPAENAGK